MNSTEIAPGSIVVGVDGSDSSARAVAWAADQAVAERRPLLLAHAAAPMDAAWLDQTGTDGRFGTVALRAYGEELLSSARVAAETRHPDLEPRTVLRVIDPRHLFLDLSEDASMVVLGSHGRGRFRSLLLGSVGVALSRRTRCPLVVHRPGNEGKVRHGVLVGVDGAPGSPDVLEFAFRQASLHGWPLTIQHSLWDAAAAVAGPHRVDAQAAEFEEQRLLVAECVTGMTEKFPDVRSELTLARGHAPDCLVLEGTRMNLLVVGRHETSALSRITRGSVATTVVEHATCPVAVVPITAA
jgi:nucleotide-binding universal stress UspA family protein